MVQCTHCKANFDNVQTLRQHLRESHADVYPHACSHCGRAFKHKVSAKRHEKTCHQAPSSSPSRSAAPPPPRATRVQHAAFEQQAALRTHLAHCSDFGQWAAEYRRARNEEDTPLSAGTEANVVSTWSRYFAPLEWDWSDHSGVCESVDQWIDEQVKSGSVQLVTTVNHIRHLRWHAMYLYSSGRTDGAVLEFLQDTIQSLQAHAHKSTSDQHCIAMLDPYQMSALRDRIMVGLQRQQTEVLHPFMARACQNHGAERDQCIAFGLQLRCWLDLALRFAAVPLRMQCTIHLLEPSAPQDHFVSKLAYRHESYVRIVYRDKSAHAHAPAEVPMGRTISAYLTFYRRYCRAAPQAAHTFQTKHGHVWKRASHDVKEYTRTALGIDPDEIEPSGRFVHGSRHMGLATYALAVNFDSERLRELAHLMRHSVAVSEKYYSVWTDRKRNERASAHFAATMGIEASEAPAVYKPLVLRTPPPTILQPMLQALWQEMHPHLNPQSTFGMRDASTQTGDVAAPMASWVTDSCTLPQCSTCRTTFVVLGPLGQRRHPKFGHYFAQCLQCDGRRPNSKNTVWYDLGYMPRQLSQSHRPRNQKAINDHIQRHVQHAADSS